MLEQENAMTHQERLASAQQALERNAQIAAKGIHRQRYHFMPRAGWMNDPNGCIWFEGKYHLFYQHNPFAPKWGAMHWGHAISSDLVHWEHCPIALAPSEPYDDHAEGGVFSGSAIDDDGTLKVFYTATTNYGLGFVQSQCLAVSPNGGTSFEKYSENPVIQAPPDGTSLDFRDPKVLKHKDKWYMVLGASLGGGAWHGGEGCMHMFASKNLIDWEYCGIIARSDGKFGTMWECPDLFPLDGKWVLTFSPMFNGRHRSMYMVGNMDFENAVFSPEHYGDLDYGMEYYALQTLIDDGGRVNHIAWQNGWDWMEGWKDFGPTDKEGWCGCAAIPRVLRLDEKNRIRQEPIPELRALRNEKTFRSEFIVDTQRLELLMPDSVCYEMELVIDLNKTDAERLLIDLRAHEAHYTRLMIDCMNNTLVFDRNQSDGHSCGRFQCPLAFEDDRWVLRIFSDTSSLEMFCDNGLTTMSNTVYAIHDNQGTFLSAEGGNVFISSCTIWALNGI
jgi:beta-fructofuranosidase